MPDDDILQYAHDMREDFERFRQGSGDANFLRRQLEGITKGKGYGDLKRSVQNVTWGINHQGVGNAVSLNNDNYGFTFFTRPNLNLTIENIEADRVFQRLIEDENEDFRKAIRHLLAPSIFSKDGEDVESALVDQRNPFIPWLTNLLVSLSGWPDHVADTYTSTEGKYKETWGMVDGFSRDFSTFDITANFRNIVGDPITLLFFIWARYATRVYEGTFTPLPDSVIENEIDYQTRIYRLVLDPSRTFVQKIAATGAAYPIVSPMGAAFDYNSESPTPQENDQISIQFRCHGVDYMDPISVHEFNTVVGLFNRSFLPNDWSVTRDTSDGVDMGTGIRRRGDGGSPETEFNPPGYMNLQTNADKDRLNFMAYPRINPATMELEWWVRQDIFDMEDPANELYGQPLR